jgi:hypothetical protein
MAEVKDAVARRCLYLPDTLEEALAEDAAAGIDEEIRAEIISKLTSMWDGMTPVEANGLVHPENYKPHAGAFLLAILDNCDQGSNPDIYVDKNDSILFSLSNLLMFYYTGDQELTREQIDAIWSDPMFEHDDAVNNIGSRRQLVAKLKKIVIESNGSPCKKKGGKKSKKNQKSKQRNKRRNKRSIKR